MLNINQAFFRTDKREERYVLVHTYSVTNAVISIKNDAGIN